MSRKKAKTTLSVEDFKNQMNSSGVWSSSVCEATLDEAPEAYKPKDEILSVINDTVDFVYWLCPLYNAKSC